MLTLLLALLAPSAHAQCSDPTVLSVDTTTSTAAAYDLFGYALVTADFDGDGYDDLGVGTPGRDVGGVTDAGQVTVFYGRSGGLSSASWSNWSQNSLSGSPNEAYDSLGQVLGAGDFNGDGYDDIVIGAPSEDQGSQVDAGRVFVKYGSASGVTSSASSNSWSQASLAGNGSQAGDRMGAAVASGDFDGDGYDDLAIGVPDDDILGVSAAGRVIIMYGSSSGLSSSNSESFNQNNFGQTPHAADRFGTALAAGDFDNDGYDDLAIGSPGEDRGGLPDVGLILVKYGASVGLQSSTISEAFDNSGYGGVDKAYDHLGAVLAVGDLDGDGIDDLLMGVPDKNVNAHLNQGLVGVLLGNTSIGLIPAVARKVYASTSGYPYLNGLEFGGAVFAADVNGDGDDDILATAPRADSNAGILFVYHASTIGTFGSDSYYVQEDCFAGGSVSSNEYFSWAVTAGDYDGDGVIEVMTGDRNHDLPGQSHAGIVLGAELSGP